MPIPIRVCMLLWDYWPGPEGGAERQCRGLVRELGRRGIDCVVVSSWSRFGIPKSSREGSAIVRRFGIFCPAAMVFGEWYQRAARLFSARHDSLIRALGFWLLLPAQWLGRLSFLLEVLVRLRNNPEHVDVLHVHETSWLAGVGVRLAKKWNVPVVCKVRNTPALEVIGYDTPCRRHWDDLRRQASFIALHTSLQQELIAEGIPESRISVIPNGVDLPAMVSRNNEGSEVLYVGNFSQGASHKGFDILIKAWALVHQALPLARLTMVGGGGLHKWEELAQKLGCAESIRFPGAVQDPAPYYQRAALFVLPSRHEGMSNALLEAQSWGLPAVVSDIPANRAVIEDRVNGILVPVGNHQAFAEAIVDLLRHADARKAMGRAARDRSERFFSRCSVTEKILSLYVLLKKKY
jgi:glycosyltransferase involved in cell wall biosynthesis